MIAYDYDRKLAALQAILPKDPDQQKEYLYETIKKDMVPINKSDVERIVYYLTEVSQNYSSILW